MEVPTASNYLWLAIVGLLAMTGIAADQPRPVPKFEGKSIPDPPQQKEPWTPPQTGLPRFLVSATADLFEQGVADPRGCEYRDVEAGNRDIFKTRGFVLPRRDGEPGRFVITWDGVIYPALSVGPPADLDKDVRTLAETMKRERAAPVAKNANRFDGRGEFTNAQVRDSRRDSGGPSGVDGRSALKVCLLLRLGRADLAETLFAAGTTWTPEVRGRDLTDYHISYLTLATDWAVPVFIRLVSAHMRGDDAIALDAARRLSTFAKAVEAKAEAMGFQQREARLDHPPSYLPFLNQLPDLLADHERRAKEPAREPIPKRGGDPSVRIAALIRDLDQIDERQMSSPGAANPGGSPLVRLLIAEGDPAVEPLLSGLENDMRLTRSVTFGRGYSLDRVVHPVYEAEFAALEKILKTYQFHESSQRLRLHDLAIRKTAARYLRAYWEKNRTTSITDRWYQMLSDDQAGSDRWLEGAGGIAESNDRRGGFIPARLRKLTSFPMRGEVLRSRRNPSVSDLMARRAYEIARSADPLQAPNMALRNAFQFALILSRWDEKASLPVVRAMMLKCIDVMDVRSRNETGEDPWLSSYVPLFTLIRADAGDRESLDQYAAWFRKIVPKDLKHQGIGCFEPMWVYAEHPAIAETARWLFNDPESPWVPLLREPQGVYSQFFPNHNIFTSQLTRVAGFRDGMMTAMREKAPLGNIRRGEGYTFLAKTRDGWSWNDQCYRRDLLALEPGVDVPFRVCDFLAWKLSSLEAAPDCQLYWSQDRRDRAVEACVAYLKRYGDRFTAEEPPGEHDFPDKKSHLAFPALGHPATLEDVRAAQAIFSLEGQGEVRLAKVPDFPIPARWITLKDFPFDRPMSDGVVHHEFEQDGWIWQAEEVRKGDHWERFLGFVGPHVIARVPSAEIELRPRQFGFDWGSLSGGLDVRVEPVEPAKEVTIQAIRSTSPSGSGIVEASTTPRPSNYFDETVSAPRCVAASLSRSLILLRASPGVDRAGPRKS